MESRLTLRLALRQEQIDSLPSSPYFSYCHFLPQQQDNMRHDLVSLKSKISPTGLAFAFASGAATGSSSDSVTAVTGAKTAMAAFQSTR